jgi:hypothetical protein
VETGQTGHLGWQWCQRDHTQQGFLGLTGWWSKPVRNRSGPVRKIEKKQKGGAIVRLIDEQSFLSNNVFRPFLPPFLSKIPDRFAKFLTGYRSFGDRVIPGFVGHFLHKCPV